MSASKPIDRSLYTQNYPCSFSGCINKENIKVDACARCHLAFYCNTHCQKRDWGHHRAYCYRSGDGTPYYESTTRDGIDIYPSLTPILSNSLYIDAQFFMNVSAYEVLTNQGVQKINREIGQAIFDKYKELGGGDHRVGKQALIRIYHWLPKNHNSDSIHIFLSRNWQNIGDHNWRWQHVE